MERYVDECTDKWMDNTETICKLNCRQESWPRLSIHAFFNFHFKLLTIQLMMHLFFKNRNFGACGLLLLSQPQLAFS